MKDSSIAEVYTRPPIIVPGGRIDTQNDETNDDTNTNLKDEQGLVASKLLFSEHNKQESYLLL